ncbi:MAG: 3-isopropylmalate dehydratase large subunit [Fimbriimonadaceae bacterium]|nr:3-isopropylmalate dehydratase large subunit [Alphaproteobacteria bacterium]
MGSTLAQKIIARAAGVDQVSIGEIVTCRVDLAMIHDSGGPRRVKPLLDRLGVGVWDPDRVVVVSDHFAPAFDPVSAAILKLTRNWAREQGITNFYDQKGICHIVLPEEGHLRPGMFVVGGDSHSPTGGAFGCFMFGIGATDMAGVLATGETWIRVPETMLIKWTGSRRTGITAKDMALAQCARLGLNGGDYRVVQYIGEAIGALDMSDRMTLCNMAAELGALTGLIEADETTTEYVRAAGGDIGQDVKITGDQDATYRATHTFDASTLEPQVAAPHSPANAAPLGDIGTVRIDQCYIGACTGAKLEDLQMAARILKGKKIASDIRLLVAPATTRGAGIAARDGTLATLIEAGAIMMPSACGACAGYGAGQLAENEICLSSTARNFKGRMGANSSQVYLASPYTVAASAITGRITDPREFINDGDAS